MSKRGLIGNIVGSQLKGSAEQLHGIQLSGVEYMKLSELTENPLNADYFTAESDENLKRLEEDVRERGILVPLIAKDDGTLLAGHNRLRIAKIIGLETVPVQRVLGKLNASDERMFLVKDNLLRRQLSQSDWIAVYKRLYPEFEAQFLKAGIENEASEETDAKTVQTGSAGRTKSGNTERLTIAKIAEETGQKPNTVKIQVKRERAKLKSAQQTPETEKKGYTVPHLPDPDKNGSDEKIGYSVPHLSNSTDMSITNLQTTLKHIEEFYLASESDTRKSVEDTLTEFMSKLSLIPEKKS